MTPARVRIMPPVQRQIEEQVLYIAIDSPQRAIAWELRLQAIEALSDFSGYAVDEEMSEQAGQALRKLVFDQTYIIHFRHVDQNIVEVVNLRHGARRPWEGQP